jgi:hypothetical protein
MSRKMIARLIAGTAALAAAGTFAVQGATAAQAASYGEYQIYDANGAGAQCDTGIYGAPTLNDYAEGVTGSPGAYIADDINCNELTYTLYEFRNPSTGDGHDVYELYDPQTNECVAWKGSSTNLFGEAGCATSNVNEQFWYGAIDSTFTELHNIGAKAYWGDERCLSALGVDTGNEVAAYKCSDDTANQLWKRQKIETS